MRVEFFLHGTPEGADYWGSTNDERQYCSNFYDGSNDKLKYVIETRNVNGKVYFYYTYLTYEIVGNNGRTGGYFGITLRFDEYCTDFMGVFRTLDTSFNAWVKGTLLKYNGATLKYAVSSFANFDANQLMNQVVNNLSSTLNQSSFKKIGNVLPSKGQYNKIFLYECTDENVLREIQRSGKVAISPYYPSSSEGAVRRQYETQRQAELQQHKAQIDEVTGKLNTANAKISTLNTQVNQLTNTCAQKEAEISKLQKQLKDYKQNDNIFSKLKQIQGPLCEVADLLRQRNATAQPQGFNGYGQPDGHKHGQPKYPQYQPEEPESDILSTLRSYLFPIIAAVVVILIFLGGCFWTLRSCTQNKSNEETKNTSSYNVSSDDQNSTDFGDGTAKDDFHAPKFNNGVLTTENDNNVKIDIKELKGKYLKVGDTYTVEAIGGVENGHFECDGCRYTPKTDNTIEIHPN